MDLGRPITALCVDKQEKYVVAIEDGSVYRLKKVGQDFQIKLIFKSRIN